MSSSAFDNQFVFSTFTRNEGALQQEPVGGFPRYGDYPGKAFAVHLMLADEIKSIQRHAEVDFVLYGDQIGENK